MHAVAVILVEEDQKEVPNMYAEGLSEAQKANSELKLDERTIPINREKEEEAFQRGDILVSSNILVICFSGLGYRKKRSRFREVKF